MANADIGLMDVLNSCQEVLEAASYKRGGRIITKTTSGSNARLGNCGTKPMINPAATNKIGIGKFSFIDDRCQTDQDGHDKNNNFEIFHTSQSL